MNKRGAIVRWDATRAFGFIRSADSAGDVFFHVRDYRGPTPPRVGLAVEFEEIHVGGKGPRAMAVRLVSSAMGSADSSRHSPNGRNRGNSGNERRDNTRQPASGKRPARALRSSSARDRTPARVTGAFIAYSLMLVWAGLLAWGVWSHRLPSWTLLVLAALNAVTLWTYASDKNAAREGGWRVPEAQLHLLSLSGGWPAAWLAQQSMRHKSSKTEFRAVYWVTIVAHCGALAWLVLSRSGMRFAF